MGDWEEAALLDTDPIEASSHIERWRRKGSVGAAVLSGFALGLQEVFYPEQREDPAIVVEAGDPPTDRPVEAHLDFEDPAASVVTVRPSDR
jgi:hypothetical protein